MKNIEDQGGFGLAISKYAKPKNESISSVEWFIYKETQITYARKEGTSGRYSANMDQEIVESISFISEYIKALETGVTVLILVVPEFNGIDHTIAEETSKSLTGMSTVQKSLDQTAARIENLLRSLSYDEQSLRFIMDLRRL